MGKYQAAIISRPLVGSRLARTTCRWNWKGRWPCWGSGTIFSRRCIGRSSTTRAKRPGARALGGRGRAGEPGPHLAGGPALHAA